MILELKEADIISLTTLIEVTVRECIIAPEADLQTIIGDTIACSMAWLSSKKSGLFLVYLDQDEVVGAIHVKNFWNLSSLFVLPLYQGQGIATKLVDQMIKVCALKSPKGKVMLNSSTVASSFYERYGFRRSGPIKDLPGGCIPYEFSF